MALPTTTPAGRSPTSQSDSFGWLENGIRGHVFADETNSTIVIAIKGTSAAIVGGNSPTGHNDKTNVRRSPSRTSARGSDMGRLQS